MVSQTGGLRGGRAGVSSCGHKPLGMRQGKKDGQGYRQIFFHQRQPVSMAHCKGHLLDKERSRDSLKIQA